jgi:CBS domain-containing protein
MDRLQPVHCLFCVTPITVPCFGSLQLEVAITQEAKMKAAELMTSKPAFVMPDDTIQDAARLMVECDCGAIPVVDNATNLRLEGVVTDRDLAVRAISQGKGPDTRVGDVMTRDVRSARPDDDLSTIEGLMAKEQVRRVPVVDEHDCLLGMISQADLALNSAASDSDVGRVVEQISEPAHA